MPQPVEIRIRVADYAPVKAALDAADQVVNAKGSAPWELSGLIDTLETRLAQVLLRNNNDDEDDGN